MCGITGLVSKTNDGKATAIDAIRRMTDGMHPCGPDAGRMWAGEGVVLGHRRQANLDLDARANQPMVSADGHWQEEGCKAPAHELQERVRQAVIDSVRAHLVADVPASVLLSGGIDSGVIAGLACELGSNLEGKTIGFEEFRNRHDDEIPVARALAAHYGLPHHVPTALGQGCNRGAMGCERCASEPGGSAI